MEVKQGIISRVERFGGGNAGELQVLVVEDGGEHEAIWVFSNELDLIYVLTGGISTPEATYRNNQLVRLEGVDIESSFKKGLLLVGYTEYALYPLEEVGW